MAGDPLEIRKIKNFVESKRATDQELIPTYKNVYIVSDSKGKYLRNEIYNIIDIVDTREVRFLCRGGRNTAEGVKYLENEISNGHIKPDRSVVLFWHITCDLNDLKRPERYLTPKYQTPVDFLDSITPSIEKLIEIHKTNENIDIGILESPPVFCSQWNRMRNHPEWQNFQDGLMHEQIDMVNQFIREKNKELNYVSPKFILDCMEFRKKKSSSSHRKSLTSVLFSDGVHPVSVVSQKWLFQIFRSICIHPEVS